MRFFDVLVLKSRSQNTGDVYFDKDTAKTEFDALVARDASIAEDLGVPLWELVPGVAMKRDGKVYLLQDVTTNVVVSEPKPAPKERDIDDDIADMAFEIRARGVTLAACKRSVFGGVDVITCDGIMCEMPLADVVGMVGKLRELPLNKRKDTKVQVLALLKSYVKHRPARLDR